MNKITTAEYTGFEKAYAHFNRALFGNELPPCLITLQRKSGAAGYFSAKRFANRSGSQQVTDEIALNPDGFMNVTDTEIMQTLVHEMAHLWQEHFGEASQRTYHNRQWAEKMQDVGLMPSSTGKPGGAKTGQKMADYVIKGGRFDRACRKLFGTGYRPNWQSSYTTSKVAAGTSKGTKKGGGAVKPTAPSGNHAAQYELIDAPVRPLSKVKFTCPGCGQNAWAKPSALLLCGNCVTAGGMSLWMEAVDGSGC